jgi:cation diffusion facilitator family transporter
MEVERVVTNHFVPVVNELDEGGLVPPQKRVSSTSRSLLEHQEEIDRRREWQLDTNHFVSLKREHADGHTSVRNFYVHQNEQIDEFVSINRAAKGIRNYADEKEAAELESRRLKGVKIAIYGSFVLNVLLFISKIAAVALSGSISLIASAVDSGLDLMSGSIIFITSCCMRRQRSVYLYPAGNTRIEPIGVIIFASAMFVTTFVIIIEAVRRMISIAQNSGSGTVTLDALTLSIICVTVAIKFFMWLYCIAYRNKSSSVRALATDHITDVVANVFLLGCYVFGYYVWAYMDPLGGILISFYLMYNWYSEGSIEVKKLSGQSAPPDFLRKITFLVWNHSPMVVAVDTVRAFHLANGFMVEVDIVLPYDMLLRDAHDIGESLQHQLEAVEDVERAYVHLDFECEHVPGTEHPAQSFSAGSGNNENKESEVLIPLDDQFKASVVVLSKN